MLANAEYQRFSNGGTAAGVTTRLAAVPFERIDDYVVVARLGQGGMAEVFLALSVGPSGFRKLVAIKRLYKHMQSDAAAVDLFLAEAALAARLQHANVVQTHKVGTFQGQHFIAMEYLDGQPLNRVLSRLRSQESRVPAVLAAQFISDALDGLHYAHEARDYDGTPLGIIHRDVSPHNIFVTFDGHVKLLDFGIARVDSLEPTTRRGIINGKFAYMAPEQALGEYIDKRADIWGMGITLWECLAGQRLFRGCNDVTVMQSSLTEDIPWVSDVAPDVPEALARIVDKALQRDADRRFSSALKFKEALDGWLATQKSPRSRAHTATTMRALFADTIARRRETLRECLARVDAIEPIPSVPVSAMPKPLSASLPPPLPAPSARPPKWIEEALPKAAAFATGAVIALVLGMLFSRSTSDDQQTATLAAGVAQAQPLTVEPAPRAKTAARPAESQTPVTSAPLVAPAFAAKPAAVTEVVIEPEAAHRRSGKHRDRKARSTEGAAAAVEEFAPEPVGSRAPDQPAAEVPSKTGRLILDSTPYSVVMLNGKRLGITPIDVELPAATHTLSLRNPERGIETPYLVTIPAGESIRRRVALD